MRRIEAGQDRINNLIREEDKIQQMGSKIKLTFLLCVALLMVFLLGVLNVAFSGYLVPVKNMPWLLNRMSYLFPVQH